MPKLLTVGIIAERTGAPVHKVQYVLKSRGVTPVSRAGNSRVFDESAVDLVARYIASRQHQVQA